MYFGRMDYKTEDTKSKFNAGLAKLERIGELRKGIHDARISKDLDRHLACLEGIRSEINAKLKQEQKKKCEEYEKKCHSSINNYYNARARKLKVISDPRLALYDYELYIGELEEKTGMGMPEEEDDGL